MALVTENVLGLRITQGSLIRERDAASVSDAMGTRPHGTRCLRHGNVYVTHSMNLTPQCGDPGEKEGSPELT